MDFTFHKRIRHFIASAPGTFVGVVDVEDPFFISSDNGVQPVESAVSGRQLSADVQASLAVAVALCMWEPLTEFFSPFREITVHCSRWTVNSQDWQQITAHLHMDAAPPDSSYGHPIGRTPEIR
ncbi:hypothetical protein RB195_019919 [Necator americanus]|uniref:Uncharacterized protein n=1 Tax=Necator americanus TaxID=51031 RepID=A0ABR1CIB0_NECAM